MFKNLFGKKTVRVTNTSESDIVTPPRVIAKPDWLRRDELKLPPWATRVETHLTKRNRRTIEIDVDGAAAYAEWLDLLSVVPEPEPIIEERELDNGDVEAVVVGHKPLPLTRPPDVIDQYWLEVAHHCIKLDLQRALEGSEHDMRSGGRPNFHIKRANDYAQANHPKGRGAEAAVRKPAPGQPDLRARVHYLRIRGRLP